MTQQTPPRAIGHLVDSAPIDADRGPRRISERDAAATGGDDAARERCGRGLSDCSDGDPWPRRKESPDALRAIDPRARRAANTGHGLTVRNPRSLDDSPYRRSCEDDAVFAAAEVRLAAEWSLRTNELRSAYRRAAAAVLVRLGEEEIADASAGDPPNKVAEKLADRIERRARAAWAIPLSEQAATFEQATRAVDGPAGPLLWADAAFARLLRSIGPKGSTLATELLEARAKRLLELQARSQAPDTGSRVPWGRLWNFWLPRAHGLVSDRVSQSTGLHLHWLTGHAPVFELLGLAIWHDELRPHLERSARNPPALTTPVFDVLAQVCRPGGAVRSLGHNQLAYEDRDGNLVDIAPQVALVASEVLEIVRAGARTLGTPNAHRLLRWLVRTLNAQWLAAVREPNRVVIDGGFARLAEAAGTTANNKAISQSRAIIYAMAHLRFPMPDGSTGNLVTYRESPARGHRQARLVLTASDPLMPGYVQRLRGSERSLVPVVDLPPFVGRPNDRGAQVAMQCGVLRLLRKRARDLASDGSTRIDADRWVELRDFAGVTTPWERVLDTWVGGSDGTPPFLRRVDKNQYTLGDAHKIARDFLIAAGIRENEGSARGRASARRRQGRTTRRRQ